MMDQTELVGGLITLNHGSKIVGKTRLQKTVYLLDACGLSSKFEYDYGNFGPFSSELAQATDDAVLLGLVESEEKPGYHAVPYTVYRTSDSPPESVGELKSDKVQEILNVLSDYSALELELAATILFFQTMKDRDKIEAEVRRRKPLKATQSRLLRAWGLLESLEINVAQLL